MTSHKIPTDADDYADRCPRESDGRHRWTAHEPPEWMLEDAARWGEAEWADWYDQAGRTCYSCGLVDEP